MVVAGSVVTKDVVLFGLVYGNTAILAGLYAPVVVNGAGLVIPLCYPMQICMIRGYDIDTYKNI